MNILDKYYIAVVSSYVQPPPDIVYEPLLSKYVPPSTILHAEIDVEPAVSVVPPWGQAIQPPPFTMTRPDE